MSNQPPLGPTDVNYLTPFTQFNQLTYNTEDCTINAGNVSATTTPTVHLDGSGRAYLRGSLTVTAASPAANYDLLSLPTNLVPNGDYYFPVCVLRAGALVSNAIKIASGGDAISSVTITNPGSYTTLPTLGTSGPGSGAAFQINAGALAGAFLITTAQSGAGSYAPGDTCTLTGGTFTTAAIITIVTTQVVSATVAAGGSGGSNGTQTVTGTTGTGTKFTASVTVSAGAITAVLSISLGGSYTVNPTVLTAEPVTGASLTGAQLNIKMGAASAIVSTAGSYQVLPSEPVSSTSGTGTGATFSPLWKLITPGVTDGGSGYTSASTFTVTGGSGVGGGAGTLVLGSGTQGDVTLLTAPQQNDIVKLDTAQFLVNSYVT